MGSEVERLDTIIAYERNAEKAAFKPADIKFAYDEEATSNRQRATTSPETGQEVIVNETVTEMKSKKVTLKTYGRSQQEDREHFFEAFERLQRALEIQWKAISSNKTNGAQVLFDAFDTMLTGEASIEWNDVLSTSDDRTWESFKLLVSEFITRKILPDDAYKRQVEYMTARRKPRHLSMQDWTLRICTLNRYLALEILLSLERGPSSQVSNCDVSRLVETRRTYRLRSKVYHHPLCSGQLAGTFG